MTWEGHQQRENLEQRAPIGESAITQEKKRVRVCCESKRKSQRERMRPFSSPIVTTLDVSLLWKKKGLERSKIRLKKGN